MLKRKTIITIFLMFYFVNVFAQKHINGLLFSSSKERKNDRTSLVLFENKELKLKDTFQIGFDFSIWDIKQFGYIFRVINENKQEISFAFVNFYGEDKIYLDFHSQITHKSVQVPITAQDITEKRWLPVDILFDLKTDHVEITLKDSTYVCKSIGLKNPSSIKFAFGLYRYDLEVPEMAVRNIRIEEGGKEICRIPLNEIAGEKVHDTEGQVAGFVKNPKWMINKHFYWCEKATFESNPSAGISYDEKMNRVITMDKDSIFAYSMQSDGKTATPLSQFPFTRNSATTIYDDANDILYIYNLKQEMPDDPTLAMVDMKNSSITYKYAQTSPFNHHNIWLGGEDGGLYIFGGLGEYSYSNELLKYSPDTDTWESVEFTGDEICPRYFSALGQGSEPSQLFIMGGIGNESGKREHGGKHLYDLFSVDINTGQIKKLWDIKDKVQSDFIPCGNIVLDENDTCFYTLCYSQYQENSVLQLYKFNISDGSYDMLGDSIYVNTEQINTSIHLFYSKLMQEFYAVIRENPENENAKVRIYSLSSPPISISELKIYSNENLFRLWLLLPVIILLIVIWYWKNDRKKKRKRKRKNVSRDVSLLPKMTGNSMMTAFLPAKEKHKKSTVFVFGEFTVFDKRGNDISISFSPKLKALFALLLFHSTNGNNEISSNMITSELWPNKNKQSAKNTRNVTISRLRNIFEDISGITLFCQDHKWYFSFDSTFYCDYLKYLEKINSMDKNNVDDNDMSFLYDILKRGTLFQDVQESWIDSHKQKYEDEIWEILWNYLLKLYQNKNYAKLIKYSDLCFIIDPLSEEVFKLCMHALKKTGKKSQAIVLYDRFVANYKELMGEKPDMSFISFADFPFLSTTSNDE